MATMAAAPAGASYSASQPFFVKLAWVLSLIIVFGFAQNAALGRVNFPAVPYWVHLHGLAMLAWLALFITQNRLAASGNLALHRKLGWVGAGLVLVIVALGSFTTVMSLALHRFPPFFSPPFFLSLALLGVLTFGALVIAAIAKRRDTETHRRLMAGSVIVILEPAFGRLLPAPLIGGELTEWIVMAIQLGFVAVIARHDKRTLGRVHPATITIGAVAVGVHVLISLASRTAPVIALAQHITG